MRLKFFSNFQFGTEKQIHSRSLINQLNFLQDSLFVWPICYRIVRHTTNKCFNNRLDYVHLVSNNIAHLLHWFSLILQVQINNSKCNLITTYSKPAKFTVDSGLLTWPRDLHCRILLVYNRLLFFIFTYYLSFTFRFRIY